MSSPNQGLISLKPFIPEYVDTVLEIGCGNGRNLIPFKDKKLIACDLAPEEDVNWAHPFEDIIYVRSLVQEVLVEGSADIPINMSSALVISFGIMMYLTKEEQEQFYQGCLARGCKNFIFREHDTDSNRSDGVFLLERHNFIEKKFNYSMRDPSTTYVSLDLDQTQKDQLRNLTAI